MRLASIMLTLCAATAGVTVPALAEEEAPKAWQSHSELEALAEQAVREATPEDGYRRTYAVQSPDPRLKVGACEELDASLYNPGSRPQVVYTVAVSCTAPISWTVYVRVMVEAWGEVVVARRPMVRGQLLHAEDIYKDERRLDRLPYGWFDTVDNVVGRPLKRSLAAGGVVTPAVVGTAHVIVSGQEVLLKASTGIVDVAMAGKALESGGRGELIRVRNLRSGQVVEGVIRSPKIVEVLVK